jgi:hypothetical protein
MAVYPSFDDFEEEGQEGGYKPFQYRAEKDKEGTLRWLNENFDQVYMASRDRLISYGRFANRYKNRFDSYTRGTVRQSHRDLGATGDNKPKVRTNFYYQYTDQKVSALSKMKLNLKFIPHNDTEQDDINDAKACETLFNFRAKQIDLAGLMTEQDRKTFKYGTSFAKIHWNKKAGPVHPKYREALATLKKVPELNEAGVPTGKNISEFDARIGDVDVTICNTENIYVERKKLKWKDIDFIEECEFVNIDQLRADHPRATIDKEEYRWLDLEGRGFNSDDQILVHHFYHRPTKALPSGCYIKYVETDILEWIDDAEEIKKMMPDCELPFVPDFDIEVEDDFWALPFLVNIEQLCNMFDLIQSGIARNIGVASHPKLMVPEGSANIKQFNNEYGIVQTRGPNEPKWLQHNYVNRGEFEIQDRLVKYMDGLSKVFDISKGQAPAGVTAATALRLLEDQEITANQQTVEKKRKRVMAVAWKMMLLMSANYRDDDGRMVTILGKDNDYLIKSFSKKPPFEKLAAVEMEYVSALSDSRSGRLADIIDLNAANQKEPTFGRKEIIKLLDLGLEDAFTEEMSYGATTSKTILEKLKAGEEVPAPDLTDDLIEMYGIFSRFVESVSYKMKLKPEVRNAIKDYVTGLEYLMSLQAKRNQMFAMNLRQFSKFPMFYAPGAEVTMAPMEMPGQKQPTSALNMAERAMGQAEPETGGTI